MRLAPCGYDLRLAAKYGYNVGMNREKMRILVAECKQEVSTFNPVLSGYGDFTTCSGDELIAFHSGGPGEMGGALEVFGGRSDIEVVPGYSARSITSGGVLKAPDFERIAEAFISCVAGAEEIDGVYFSLHGAMATENNDDPEGYLLSETRRILGSKIPIVISLDLHGVLTDTMLEHCDGVTVYHTYPHVDFSDTGARAAKLLLSILDGACDPVMARVPIPALVRGDELITKTGLLGNVMQSIAEVEGMEHGLAAAVQIGNPFTDVPDLCSNALVITDGDPDLAERKAIEIAKEFWGYHERMTADLTPLEKAITEASECEGSVIFYDPADATSSGAPGDSNAILRGLMDSGYPGKALLPIVDPGAVAQARASGIGAVIKTNIGGAFDSVRFTPVEITAKVRMLSDGKVVNESHGTVWDAGDTAVIETGNITIVVTTRAISLYDRSLFLSHGLDPRRFDLVVVKSPHCRHEYFNAWAEKSINIDVPGATSADLRSLGHTKCRRPIFPLDGEVEFEPKAKIFRRG